MCTSLYSLELSHRIFVFLNENSEHLLTLKYKIDRSITTSSNGHSQVKLHKKFRSLETRPL